MREILDSLLLEIGKRIGFDGLCLDEENIILLDLENELYMMMRWRDDTQTLLFNAILCTRPCDDLERLKSLMHANAELTDGHGMSFNIDAESNLVNLSQVVSIADNSSFALQEKIELFINISTLWHERLNSSETLHLNSRHPEPGDVGVPNEYLEIKL
ncbi:hypothetical protein SIAM614_00382 [Stappia aggregata IAM 12614]|uniref:Tir chaperone family protein CesT n=1 Tax=Roseibium aggregatum (strain ATCC 25650 / DSM 13394 / JCM 20685 / NBRC 16684 / NCIMB 2208 / IAM 12614 / B1) TaxID=384765 RepID=A0P2J9_ROSAI|nr:CesT family type III secretion system chaperone [Roseibium aggregatum]EAV40652.1 hypothetical protein SIAM614_00382 [Stappia aggregata IAM 12614] [Roseibium aggregatum IAM 12614]